MAPATTIRMVLPSEIHLVDLAHHAAERLASICGLDEDEALNVGIAVREAVINAMKHGNGLDPERKVAVVLSAGPKAIRVRVLDEGPGFDPAAAPDPRDPENILRASGRGLLMIRAFSDKVAFRYRPGRGMEITLEKRVHSPSRLAAARP